MQQMLLLIHLKRRLLLLLLLLAAAWKYINSRSDVQLEASFAPTLYIAVQKNLLWYTDMEENVGRQQRQCG